MATATANKCGITAWPEKVSGPAIASTQRAAQQGEEVPPTSSRPTRRCSVVASTTRREEHRHQGHEQPQRRRRVHELPGECQQARRRGEPDHAGQQRRLVQPLGLAPGRQARQRTEGAGQRRRSDRQAPQALRRIDEVELRSGRPSRRRRRRRRHQQRLRAAQRHPDEPAADQRESARRSATAARSETGRRSGRPRPAARPRGERGVVRDRLVVRVAGAPRATDSTAPDGERHDSRRSACLGPQPIELPGQLDATSSRPPPARSAPPSSGARRRRGTRRRAPQGR